MSKTFHYTVSRLTKPWALKGCESAIRALAGDAIKPEDKIFLKINKDKKLYNVYQFEPTYQYSGGCVLVAESDKRKAIKSFNEDHSNPKEFEFVGIVKGLKSEKVGIIVDAYFIE